MRIVHRLLSALALLLAINLPVQAAKDANADLYDAVAPADSAFVRVLNLSDKGVDVTLSGKVNPQKVAAGQLGGYRFVPPGRHRIAAGALAAEPELKANTATTLLYTGSELIPVADKFVNEPKKAQVAFYNLTGQDVALKTLDGKHAIVEPLGKNQTGSRMVNEIKIGFAAYAGEQNLARFDELFLKKGRSYSYVLLPQGSGYRTISLANSIDPTE
ncbi:alginate O-acetyltransferase AlgF [Pseudomonas sp. A46]|nr:alginate O-acetyltransferase AlgF [Pseudomonas sp. A46]OWJ95983.1 alginate O-acetyltransferase [Pseudomonas sp. A46]